MIKRSKARAYGNERHTEHDKHKIGSDYDADLGHQLSEEAVVIEEALDPSIQILRPLSDLSEIQLCSRIVSECPWKSIACVHQCFTGECKSRLAFRCKAVKTFNAILL